jgi:hypothetical protein
MPTQPHPAVRAVHEAAAAVLSHDHQAPSGSFWRRWFDAPHERHLADEVRAFVVSLDLLLDVPPTMLSQLDLTEIHQQVDRVVTRVEEAIDEPGQSGTDAAPSLAQAVYVIRTRYEVLYRRGATKAG